MRDLGSIPTEGNIFTGLFFVTRNGASDAGIGIVAILVYFEKNSM